MYVHRGTCFSNGYICALLTIFVVSSAFCNSFQGNKIRFKFDNVVVVVVFSLLSEGVNGSLKMTDGIPQQSPNLVKSFYVNNINERHNQQQRQHLVWKQR